MISFSSHRQRFLAPEVIQTSAMDCGPAALKCLLEGFGTSVSYGRLREACQTDVDGTSIDTLEEIANQLGLDAEQVMIPADHLFLPEVKALPALLVVRLPNGLTHFLVVWRRHGAFLQVMDPAAGRQWVDSRKFLEKLYIHSFSVPAEDWHEWAKSPEFCRPLTRRVTNLGIGRIGNSLINEAITASGWQALATFDAAVRLTESLAQAGAVKRGVEALDILKSLLHQAQEESPGQVGAIPEIYWSVQPASAGPDGDEQLSLKGAVIVRIRGRKAAEKCEALSPELAAAITESPSRPGRDLIRIFLRNSALSTMLLVGGLMLASVGVVFEAVLLRSVMGIASDLQLVEQRLQSLGYFLIFVSALFLIEWQVARGLLRMGRFLEVHLRIDFLQKIPFLNDRYFQSRPISDMAERSHSTHNLRMLPWLSGQLIRTMMTLVVTTAAICWLDPASTPIAIIAAGAIVALPLVFKPQLVERDLRVRTHTGALARFYLDALIGIIPVRAHAAERSVRSEHEGLVVEWARASVYLIRSVITIETLVALVGFGLASWLLISHAYRGVDPASSLLLAYWALQLPVLGDELSILACQYPRYRNLVLRLIEPLGAPEEIPTQPISSHRKDKPIHPSQTGVSIVMESVSVRAAGRTILEDINTSIEPGSHVAIVGPSGAGKSSLVGLLLGWHRAVNGSVLIDGHPLDNQQLDRLRNETTWVDPAIQIWNRSVVQNLLYGNYNNDSLSLDQALSASELYEVLPRLEDGLQTALGGSGGLLSGGQGQRVRFGRAWCRNQPRLVILDEPFRSLDRTTRRKLMHRARQRWNDATLLCITHDVGETRDFDRVIVIDDARIVEDGCPQTLEQDRQSRYRALLDTEQMVHTKLWSQPTWRRLRLQNGQLIEDGPR